MMILKDLPEFFPGIAPFRGIQGQFERFIAGCLPAVCLQRLFQSVQPLSGLFQIPGPVPGQFLVHPVQ